MASNIAAKLRSANKGTSPSKLKEQVEQVHLAMETQTGTELFRDIETDRLEFHPDNNYRDLGQDTEEQLNSLAVAIDKQGLLHNLVISQRKDGRYVVLSGERRLRAIRLLREESDEKLNRWRTVKCKVLTNLTPRQEMIFLDAANLETRGTLGGSEILVRKIIKRYVDNLKAEYNIEPAAALLLAQEASGQDERTVSRNISLEEKSNPKLLRLLDEGVLKKREALLALSMTAEEQEQVANAFLTAQQAYKLNGNAYNTDIENVRNIVMQAMTTKNNTKERAALLAEAQQTADRILLYEQKEAVKRSQKKSKDNLPAMPNRTRRDFYLAQCDQMIERVKRYRVATINKRLRSFDVAAETDGQKILPRLVELRSQLDELITEMEAQ